MPTKIEWTEETWNPVTGCTKVSPGCARCYAERIARRFPEKFPHGFAVHLRPERLSLPLRWKKPRMVFLGSMTDLFHDEIPEDYLAKIFEVVRTTPHVYQVLTKRPERMRDLALSGKLGPWPKNLWAGVTVESAKYAWRADLLREVPARIRFVSFEPLLGPIEDFDFSGIHWAIVGGESGPGARSLEEAWVWKLYAQAKAAGVAFFFKQWGGRGKHDRPPLLDGKLVQEWPQIE